MSRIANILLIVSLIGLAQCKQDESLTHGHLNIDFIEEYRIESSQDIDFITSFQFENSDVWVGTFNSGVHHISNDEYLHFNIENSSLPDNKVNDLFIDHEKRIWIATDGGLVLIQSRLPKANEIVDYPNVNSTISQIAVNETGDIVFGYGNVENGGIMHIKGDSSWVSYNTKNSRLPCNLILDIEIDNKGAFIVSTGQFQGKGGVVKIDKDGISEILVDQQSGLLYNWVDHIELTMDDDLWVGYDVLIYNETGEADGGIQNLSLDDYSIESFFPNTVGDLSNRIRSMVVSQQNTLWFVTGFDDPYCENCIPGIGLIRDESIYYDEDYLTKIKSNSTFNILGLNESNNVYLSNELSIYRLETDIY